MANVIATGASTARSWYHPANAVDALKLAVGGEFSEDDASKTNLQGVVLYTFALGWLGGASVYAARESSGAQHYGIGPIKVL